MSFVETGRSQASSEMVVRLAETLEILLRERNVLLLATGYAPLYPERPRAWLPARPTRGVERAPAREACAAKRRSPAIRFSRPSTPRSAPTRVSSESSRPATAREANIVVPVRLREGEQELAFIATLSTSGTRIDSTVSELSIEAFSPANAQTAIRMMREVEQ